ncbi:hypothetical protein K438DRAFT_732726 [Mycena galopus ATCC 62051]|nr:hypothetical protein K438DRAFT_732726 [Mycena galopus ATCC 62051]
MVPGDLAKADQIAFHIYTKLFHVLYATGASDHGQGQGQRPSAAGEVQPRNAGRPVDAHRQTGPVSVAVSVSLGVCFCLLLARSARTASPPPHPARKHPRQQRPRAPRRDVRRLRAEGGLARGVGVEVCALFHSTSRASTSYTATTSSSVASNSSSGAKTDTETDVLHPRYTRTPSRSSACYSRVLSAWCRKKACSRCCRCGCGYGKEEGKPQGKQRRVTGHCALTIARLLDVHRRENWRRWRTGKWRDDARIWRLTYPRGGRGAFADEHAYVSWGGASGWWVFSRSCLPFLSLGYFGLVFFPWGTLFGYSAIAHISLSLSLVSRCLWKGDSSLVEMKWDEMRFVSLMRILILLLIHSPPSCLGFLDFFVRLLISWGEAFTSYLRSHFAFARTGTSVSRPSVSP